MTTALEGSERALLKMEGISKSFSGVAALSDVKLEVARGEVHALMGENGAGKSTLMRILSGIVPKDSGHIRLDGAPVNIKSPKAALDLGVSMIHQELNPVRAMTVAENIFLGKEPCHPLTNVVDTRKQRSMTLALLREMDISISPDSGMERLSVAEMQMVEIIKAISYDSRIIIMDEPTSAITSQEVTKLFDVIRDLKARGIAIIYISHKIEEIFRICDRITVLRDGRYIETRPAAEFDGDTLVNLMVGREIGEWFPKVDCPKGDVSLEVERLTKRGVFQGISFSARKGEILGFAGLMGAGRTEIMETVFGLRRAEAGSLRVNGREVRIRSAAEAIKNGIALITEDRQLKGLNLKASVKDNITLVNLERFTRFTQILRGREENLAVDSMIRKLGIKTSRRGQIVKTLSGGNQQKVVLAKWLLNDPEIIILDEPTRGIDVGAKAEIYKIIVGLAGQGKTIIMVSSELEEIIGLCDRVIVVCRGKISGEFERASFTQGDHESGDGKYNRDEYGNLVKS